VEKAQKHLTNLQGTLAAGSSDLMARLSQAEHSYQAAYDAYAQLVAACKRISEGRLEAWELPEEEVYAVRLGAGYPLRQVHTPSAIGVPISRLDSHSSDSVRPTYEREPRAWERFIKGMDKLSYGIAFVLALAGGMATKYADQATFGSWQDYLVAALWGFGVSEITNASLGEVQKALYKKEEEE
jgi:hypothetical protein